MKANSDVIVEASSEHETMVCRDYDELAEMITRWLEEYQEIEPQIQAICNRGLGAGDLARDSVPFGRCQQ